MLSGTLSDSVHYASSVLQRLTGRTLIVPHVVKNGGTAINSLLLSVRPRLNLSGMGTHVALDLRTEVLVLHLADSLTRVIAQLQSPVALLAVVRDPVDRVLSEFLFMRARQSICCCACAKYVRLPPALSARNVTWRQWAYHASEQNYQLSYLRGFSLFTHVSSERDWLAWLDTMARTPVVLLTMESINALVPTLLEHAFPGRVVTERKPLGRWGYGVGVGGINASLSRAPIMALADRHAAVALPGPAERESIRQLNALDERLHQLAKVHAAAYGRLLSSQSARAESSGSPDSASTPPPSAAPVKPSLRSFARRRRLAVAMSRSASAASSHGQCSAPRPWGSRPELFRGAVGRGFPRVANWTDELLAARFGALPCSYGEDARPASGGHYATYRSFMDQRNRSMYTFTRRGAESREFEPFLHEMSFPNPHFGRREVERHIVYSGDEGTGALPHIHGPAFNLLAVGSKRWIMFDAASKNGSELQRFYYARYPQRGGERVQWQTWYDREYSSLVGNRAVGTVVEITQRAGDIVYVPARFSHTVLNLEAVTGITVEVGCSRARQGLTKS